MYLHKGNFLVGSSKPSTLLKFFRALCLTVIVFMLSSLFLIAISGNTVKAASLDQLEQYLDTHFSDILKQGVNQVIFDAFLSTEGATGKGQNLTQISHPVLRESLAQFLANEKETEQRVAFAQQQRFTQLNTSTTPTFSNKITLQLQFILAANQSHFPLNWLKAFSFPLSNWEQQPTIDGGYGVMHLMQTSNNDSLDQAAKLINSNSELLKTDSLLNIEAGAALLRSMAQKSGLPDNASLTQLAPVLAQWSGLDPTVTQLYIDEVFKLLNNGFSRQISTGESVSITAEKNLPAVPTLPSNIASASPKLHPNSAITSPDYPPATLYPVADVPGTKYDYGRTANISSVVTGFGEGQSRGTLLELLQYFASAANPISTHYVVGLDGSVYEMVAEANTAYYIGSQNPPAANNRSYENNDEIGVSLEGYAGDTPSSQMYARLKDLFSNINSRRPSNVGLDCNSIVSRNYAQSSGTPNPGTNFDWSQVIPGGNHDCTTVTPPPPPPPSHPTNSNVGHNPNQYTGGEPVNTFNGNFMYTVNLLTVAGNDEPLDITLTYNSLDTNSGHYGLGQGWSINIGTHLTTSYADGSVDIYYADGRSTYFTRNQDGSYSEQPGFFDHLVKNGDGTYTLTNPNLQSWQFDGSGKLLSQTDRNGNRISYSYNANNQITDITDTANRHYTLSYDGNGKLSTITDPASRQVKLGYVSGNGNLQTVTDMGGNTTSFTYGSNNRISAVTDGNNNIFITNQYDAQNRVVQQTDPNGKTFRFQYGNNNTLYYDQDNNGTLIEFDSNGNPTRITDALGGVTQKVYDANNNLIQLTTPDGHQWHYTYDNNGNMLTMIDPNNHTTTMQYDSNNNIVKVIDARNGVYQYFYDAKGNLTKSTRPDGSFILMAYDAQGRLTTMTDGRGNTTTFQYDAAGNLVAVTDPTNATTHFQFDAVGRLTATTDAMGRQITNTYDGMGNLTTQADALNRIAKYYYDGNYNLVKFTDRNGSNYTMTYNFNNQQTTLTDPLGHAINSSYNSTLYLQNQSDARGVRQSYTYDALHRVTSVTDALNHTTYYYYDGDGYLVKEIAPDGGVTLYQNNGMGQPLVVTDALNYTHKLTYDELGRVSSVTDGQGNTTTFQYDSMGRITKVNYPIGNVSFTYDANGNLLTQTDQLNRTTSYQYDKDNRLIQTADPAGNTTKLTYDADGEVITTADGNNHVTTYNYDKGGRVSSVVDAYGNTLTYSYDNEDRVTQVVDQLGRTTKIQYDAAGRMVQMTDTNSGVTKFSYDASNNLISETSPTGRVQTFAYDLANQLTSVTNGLNQTTSYQYNAMGRVIQQTDPNNHVTQQTYDALGRLVGIKDAKKGVTTYTYDANGNPLSTINPVGAETDYAYDALNHLTTVTDANKNVTSLSYDIAGQLISVKKPTGGVTAFGYDAVGRLNSMQMPNGGITMLSYDGVGNLTKLIDPLQHSSTYQYDSLNRMVKSTDGNSFSTTYTYDKVGNQISVTDPNNHTTQTTYDNLNRVSAVTDARGATTSYGYDGDGKLTSVTDANSHTTSYQYDVVGRLAVITSPRGAKTQLGYDAAGNLTTVKNALNNTYQLGYDELNQLISVTNPLGKTINSARDALSRVIAAQDANGNVTSYTYDGMNQLTSVKDANGNVSKYAYDGNGNKISYADARGNTEKWQYDAEDHVTTDTNALGYSSHYTYDKAGNQASMTDANNYVTTFSYDGNNQLLAKNYPNKTKDTFTYDKVGNLTTMIDQSGTSKFSYDAANQLLQEVRTNNNDGKSRTTSVTYDAVGNQTSLTYPDGKTEHFYYNADNQLQTAVDGNNGSFQYARDLLGQVQSLTYPDKMQKVQTYNAASQLTSLTYLRPNGNLLQRSEYQLDANGNVTQQNNYYPKLKDDGRVTTKNAQNTAVPSINENASSNLTSPIESDSSDYSSIFIDGQNGVQQSIQLPSTILNGNSVASDNNTKNKLNSDSVSYTYNDLSQLTSENYSDGRSINYTLDPNGNVTSEQVSKIDGKKTTSVSQSLTYNAANELTSLSQPGGVTNFNYDGNGNLVAQHAPHNQLTTYSYNYNNQLTQVQSGVEFNHQPKDSSATIDNSGATPDNSKPTTLLKNVASYTYDGMGRLQTANWGQDSHTPDITVNYWGVTRISGYATKGTAYSGVGSADYTLGDNNAVIGATFNDPEYGNSKASNNSNSSSFGDCDKSSSNNDCDNNGNASRYFLSDRLGSVFAATNSHGNVIAGQTFSSYGSVTASENQNAMLFLGFTGQNTDPATGLNSFYARWYNPSTMRWQTQDSYRGNPFDPTSQNRSLYVRSNPTNLTDPLGFFDDATGTIQWGDTLSGIAYSHNISISSILALNPQITNPNLIYAGHHLNLPGAGTTNSSRSNGGGYSTGGSSYGCSYTVQSGDTLSGIAAQYGVSYMSIAQASGISNPDRIFAGQRVSVPCNGGSFSGGYYRGSHSSYGRISRNKQNFNYATISSGNLLPSSAPTQFEIPYANVTVDTGVYEFSIEGTIDVELQPSSSYHFGTGYSTSDGEPTTLLSVEDSEGRSVDVTSIFSSAGEGFESVDIGSSSTIYQNKEKTQTIKSTCTISGDKACDEQEVENSIETEEFSISVVTTTSSCVKIPPPDNGNPGINVDWNTVGNIALGTAAAGIIVVGAFTGIDEVVGAGVLIGGGLAFL